MGAPFDVLDRFAISFDTSSWQPMSSACESLAESVRNLVVGIGGFLSTDLYKEVIIFLQGGESNCVRRLPVMRQGVEFGTHPIYQYANGHAFIVTSLRQPLSAFAKQLRILLGSLSIDHFQLFNIYHRDVQFVTVSKLDQLREGKSVYSIAGRLFATL